MTSKTVTSLAFAAGCALALGAMPSAHAQAVGTTTTTWQQPPPISYTPAQPAPGYATAPPAAYAPAPPAPGYAAGPPELVTNGPQASRGDFGDWSARQNVIESAHYDRLLQTNLAFRRFRMRKECGPISDPQLRGECLASFQQYEPVMYGATLPRRRLRGIYGR